MTAEVYKEIKEEDYKVFKNCEYNQCICNKYRSSICDYISSVLKRTRSQTRADNVSFESFLYLQLRHIEEFKIKQTKINKIDDMIKELRNRNPYPKEVFITRTKTQWNSFHNALEKELGEKGDGYLGSHSRDVWNNCCNELEEILNGFVNEEIEIILLSKDTSHTGDEDNLYYIRGCPTVRSKIDYDSGEPVLIDGYFRLTEIKKIPKEPGEERWKK